MMENPPSLGNQPCFALPLTEQFVFLAVVWGEIWVWFHVGACEGKLWEANGKSRGGLNPAIVQELRFPHLQPPGSSWPGLSFLLI